MGNTTTVRDLLERLKVAEPQARVVFCVCDETFGEFDVRCISPSTEVCITPGDDDFSLRIGQLEGEVAELEGQVFRLDSKIRSAVKLLDAMEYKFPALDAVMSELKI